MATNADKIRQMTDEELISPVFWLEGGHGAFQKVGSMYNLYDADGDYFGSVFSFGEVCRRLEERGKNNERCN